MFYVAILAKVAASRLVEWKVLEGGKDDGPKKMKTTSSSRRGAAGGGGGGGGGAGGNGGAPNHLGPGGGPGPHPAMSGSMPGPECAGCQKPIRERFLLKALDQLWHEDCLKCACCDCRLGEVGSTLFTKANLILCKRDYLRTCEGLGTMFTGPKDAVKGYPLPPGAEGVEDTRERERRGEQVGVDGVVETVAYVVAATRPFESLGRGIEFLQCLAIATESYYSCASGKKKEDSTGQKSLEAINGPLETSPGAPPKPAIKITRNRHGRFSRTEKGGGQSVGLEAAVSADAAAVRVGKPPRVQRAHAASSLNSSLWAALLPRSGRPSCARNAP
ncbi:hypothetical protein HPB51_015343 [Rhipicephalus microplus]|uniref:LIM zinc-binding domain-containing protein n=1 Tax=Rhipicephalus microplus TaxID=6941 RepID=A0A9J6DVU5_RHIMP|nr:hypothetical protein HPB51_015343 [Rhipicephalus microplus]